MRYYAVLDTNVLVSAMLKDTSIPGQVVVEALIGGIIPLYNNEILTEYADVLARPKFQFDKMDVRLLIDTIIKRGIPVDAGPIEDVLPDPKDTVFYAVTMEKKKTDDAYLVTGNEKHFPKVPFVVTPREMLKILRETPAQSPENELPDKKEAFEHFIGLFPEKGLEPGTEDTRKERLK